MTRMKCSPASLPFSIRAVEFPFPLGLTIREESWAPARTRREHTASWRNLISESLNLRAGQRVAWRESARIFANLHYSLLNLKIIHTLLNGREIRTVALCSCFFRLPRFF